MELVNAITGERAFAIVIAAFLTWEMTVNRREMKAELREVRGFVQTELAEMNMACQTALNRVADVLGNFVGKK